MARLVILYILGAYCKYKSNLFWIGISHVSKIFKKLFDEIKTMSNGLVPNIHSTFIKNENARGVSINKHIAYLHVLFIK